MTGCVFRCSLKWLGSWTNGAGVASRCLVLLIGMFTDVMPLEVVPSVKVSVAHLTGKATRLTMNGLSMPLQRFLSTCSKVLAQRSHTAVSLCLLEGGKGNGSDGGGKSTVASIAQPSKSERTSTAGRCTFM